MTASNLAPRLEEQLTGLREMLAEQEQEMEARKLAFDESRENVSRLRRAVEALDPTPREKVTIKDGNGNGQPSGKQRWVPSEETRTKVLGSMQGKGKLTVPSIAKEAGVSEESVRRTMEWARTKELVRFAGIGRGNGKLYEALDMPEPVEATS